MKGTFRSPESGVRSLVDSDQCVCVRARDVVVICSAVALDLGTPDPGPRTPDWLP
jgi:hypothetical protein